MTHHYLIPSSAHSLLVILLCLTILYACQFIEPAKPVSLRVVCGWLVGVGVGLTRWLFEK
ncbi:hypothetical protein [Spirosoma sp. 48-14]|uniref:hypothetical protein n=1 Tax=Spirosoma sp. 48-14 TaxID=1895854 RepID=UPI000AED35CA|nr:hypothetical protein [Spirosoma sp. 48-14]